MQVIRRGRTNWYYTSSSEIWTSRASQLPDIQSFLNEQAAQYKKAMVKGDGGVLKEILDSAVDDIML